MSVARSLIRILGGQTTIGFTIADDVRPPLASVRRRPAAAPPQIAVAPRLEKTLLGAVVKFAAAL